MKIKREKAPIRISLGTYLGILLLLISGLPILVFLLWPNSLVYDQKLAEVRERQLLIASNLSASLEVYHRDVMAVMDSFAISIADGKAIDAKPIFENLKFRTICVVDQDSGTVLDRYLDQEHACPDVVQAPSLTFLNALTAQGGVQMSGVRPAPDGQPQILVVTAYNDKLVMGALHTDVFIERQRQINFATEAHATILDQYGGVLAHPAEEWKRTSQDLSAKGIVQRVLNGEKGVMTFFSDVTDQEIAAGFAPVNGSGWGVIVLQPLQEFELAAEAFKREVVFILLIGLGVSLVMAYFLSRSFSIRIENIQSAVKQIASGRHEVTVWPRNKLVDVIDFRVVEDGISKMAEDMHSASQFQDCYSQELETNNIKLRNEINVRSSVEGKLRQIGTRYQALFEKVPIPIREEDLSGFKKLVDELAMPDEDALNHYLDGNPEFINRCGSLARVLHANEASLELHEYENEALLIKKIHTEFGPESCEFIRKSIVAIYSGETRVTSETAIYRSTGEKRDLQTTWSVLPGHEADFSRVLLTSIDMTDRLASEKALRQAQKMEAVGQLTGGVSHDFNNLLTVVGGSADLLSMDPVHDSILVKRIQKAVNRGAELTQRLLAFSRIQPLQPQTIDLQELASEIQAMLQRTLGPNIDIRTHAEENIFQIHADPGQVEAAILNLALNARDAMPDGGQLQITCRKAETEEMTELGLLPGTYSALDVIDSGKGMSSETALRAFEPFFTTKDVGKGSGLGLSMVYGFARQSKGGTLIRSNVGSGTTVTLLLPKSEIATEQKRPREQHVRKEVTNRISTNQTILILEDDTGVLNHLISLLTELGYKVVPASSTKAAWDIVNTGTEFDLLLSDVMLPEQQSGPAFAKELRLKRPDCPVIFISGFPDASAVGMKHTLQDAIWLKKPFKTADLSHAIRRALVTA